MTLLVGNVVFQHRRMDIVGIGYDNPVRTCSLIRNCISAAQLPSRRVLADAVLLAWRNQLLDDIARALSPWLFNSGTGKKIELQQLKSQRVVDMVNAFCGGVALDDMPDIETICSEIGGS